MLAKYVVVQNAHTADLPIVIIGCNVAIPPLLDIKSVNPISSIFKFIVEINTSSNMSIGEL